VNAFDAVQTNTVTFNLTTQVGGGNASQSTGQMLVTVGEWALGNATAGSGSFLVGFFYTTNTSFNGSVAETLVCISSWECTGWVVNGSLQYRSCNIINISDCNNQSNKPVEVEARMSFWEAGVALIYVFAVALFVVYGFTIKDKQLKEIADENGAVSNIIVNNWLLTGLKIVYLLTMPAFVLLGIGIAREMATASAAPTSVTDLLTTGYQIFMYIYLFTLLIFVILIIQKSISAFVHPLENIFTFRKKGRSQRTQK
jgi:hypothetical protein